MAELEPMLTIRPQIVQEFRPRLKVGEMILRIADLYGCREQYLAYGYGSMWYVELPRYIQELVDEGRTARAEQCLSDCFGEGISAVWRRAMAGQSPLGDQEV